MSELSMPRISEHLERLKLLRMKEVLPSVIEEAHSKKSSYLEVIDRLLEEEVNVREERRVKTALKTGNLPSEKTIEQYDFSFNPELDKREVMNLFELDFLKNHSNAIFLGPPGVGKTHLASALAIRACHAGVSIYFTTMADLIVKLRKDEEASRKGRGRSYYKSALVVVDEVGYAPLSREEAHLFFQFISNRYERASTVITSNKSFTEWGQVFGDPVIVTAILDRLLHHCIVLSMKGKSYRLKNYEEQELARREQHTIKN